MQNSATKNQILFKNWIISFLVGQRQNFFFILNSLLIIFNEHIFYIIWQIIKYLLANDTNPFGKQHKLLQANSLGGKCAFAVVPLATPNCDKIKQNYGLFKMNVCDLVAFKSIGWSLFWTSWLRRRGRISPQPSTSSTHSRLEIQGTP